MYERLCYEAKSTNLNKAAYCRNTLYNVSCLCSYAQAPHSPGGRLGLKCDGTRAKTRFRLSAKRASPFKQAGASVQSTTGSRGVRISGSNAGYTMFWGSVKVLATHSIRQFPLHFSRASSCAITFQLDPNTNGAVCDLRSALCSVLQVFRKLLQPEGLTMRGAIPPFPIRTQWGMLKYVQWH